MAFLSGFMKAVRSRAERRSGHRERRGARTRTRRSKPVVLVVDDMEDNRDLFTMVLARGGYAVHIAVDGHDGVERARQLRPSVIVMDLAMPKVDGFEATERIRALPELAGVRIIAVTAYSDAASVERARAAGCDEVLAKPCPPAVLLERVAAALASQEEAAS